MTDRFTVRAVVIGLILIALAVVAALVYILAVVDVNPDQKGMIIGALTSLASLSAGAVAAVLAHTATNNADAP